MASVGLTAGLTPNVPHSADALSGDFIQNGCLRCEGIMQQSSLMHSRSRRPLSVDDVHVAEAFLVDKSFANLSGSYGEDSGVFLSSPNSSSSSLSCSNKGTGKSTFDFESIPLSTSTPNPQRRLFSCPEDLILVIPDSTPMEVLFNELNEDIGASWRKLGRYLLKRECMLNNIDADFSGVGEKAHQLLLKWKEESGSGATPQVLFEAMLQIKRTDVAKKLVKLAPSLMSFSHMLESVIASDSMLYNSYKLNPENLEVEKTLLLNDEKVLVCSNTETSQRFVLKQVEDEDNAFAVRKCIDCKALRQQHQRLRKTEQFLKDLEMKQKMIQDLLGVIQQLQSHLHSQHQAISQQQFSCSNCVQYKVKQDLVQKELTLLHYELQRMIQSNRRISVSGIPSERIYNLATRTYTVCEEHLKMHMQSRNRRSVCQHPDDNTDSSDDDEIIQGPLACALNVIIGIGRRRKVTQSLKIKKSSTNGKLKLAKSNSNPPSSSGNALSNRQSYFLAQENPVMLPVGGHMPGDWSGVPAFKMSSDFKMPSSSDNSAASNTSRCTSLHTRYSEVPQKNPATLKANKNDHIIPLQWVKGIEPDELII